MKMMKQAGRVALLLVFVLSLMMAELRPAAAVTWADVNELKDEVAALDAQKKEAEARLKELANDKSKALEHKKLLDQQMGILASQISAVEKQINNYQSLIVQTQAELEEAEQKEQAQYELFCKRVRAMEENGKVSYWSVLFQSADFSDLLGRLDFINEIMEADQRVIDELQILQQEISDKKADLQTQLSEEQDAKADLLVKKTELDKQRKESDRLVAEINGNSAEYKATLAAIDAEEEAIQKKIVELSRQLAAQNNQGNAALGGYIWPTNSHKVNSPFGKRNTGISGASTNHKGIDIGAVYYSSEVRAAKAGTVIVSQYSSSYGNYVVVSHGSGNTTLYAHMSSRKVSVGQSVAQGDVLGITGSTGISSGPHLHFEITENGQRIDPLKYLTNYTKGW